MGNRERGAFEARKINIGMVDIQIGPAGQVIFRGEKRREPKPGEQLMKQGMSRKASRARKGGG